MPRPPITVRIAVLLLGCMASVAHAQSGPAAELPLFAIEIKTGPAWDPEKPPRQQTLFAEHSANLKRLRDAGSLVMGARYSDKGLVVVAAPALEQARAMIEADPSIAAGTFSYELHPFNVFYPGTVQARPRQ